MKIARVEAVALNVPIDIALVGVKKTTNLSACLVEVEADDGTTGYGFTAITEEEVVREIVNAVAGPAIVGDDPLANERVWDKLYWMLSPRGQTGYALHAIAAIDIALWDIKGKALGQPIWRLLGGARSRVPVYATFGLSVFDRGQLAEAARLWVSQGHRRLKMVVGHEALKRRDSPRPPRDVIREDFERVRAVREAVGDGIELFVDANCSLDLVHAVELARMIEPLGITFFEEPVTQNDVPSMAEMRRRTTIPLACGQNEGLAFRFRDFLVHRAVDYLQPNVAITGGFTQCVRIAGMAAAFNVPIVNGGAWPHHNMHLHAGLANGGLVEYHYGAIECCRQIFTGLAVPEDGWMDLPEEPGLGFAPDLDAVRELAARPAAGGRGKG